MKEKSKCTICKTFLTGRQKMYCSIKCKNKAHQSYPSQKKRGLKRKLNIVKKLGGKCIICGYCKNLASLTFHHIEPSKKKFKLDVRSLSNRKISEINKELNKCELLCHNCHAETHFPEYDLESKELSRLL